MVNDDSEDTRLACNTGAKVRCKTQTTREGEQILVAYKEASI